MIMTGLICPLTCAFQKLGEHGWVGNKYRQYVWKLPQRINCNNTQKPFHNLFSLGDIVPSSASSSSFG
jgi:hypothetical protein